MHDTDFEQDTGRPIGLYLVVGVLAIIGAIWLVGFFVGTVLGFLFKLLVFGLVIMAVAVAIRVIARR